MAILDEFKNAVNSGNLTLVRVMIKNCMLEDKSLDSFKEELAYAESNMSNLYDEHDGEKFDYDTTKWTGDYLDSQIAAMLMNFSRERVDYVASLIKHIYADERADLTKEKFIKERGSTPNKAVGTGLVVGGTAAVAAGIAIASGEAGMTAAGIALGGIGAACIIAGGVILYKNLK